jgi:hypothetical protein
LDEERGKQIRKFLFIDVPEVEIEIGHRGTPIVAQGCDILYDRGTKLIKSILQQLRTLT